MKRIFLGSNPIAFGAPGGDGPPVIVDMSTTHAAWGKVIVARQEGKPIPADWAVDAQGKATTDAGAAVGLAPTGAHKGYALAMMVEILCALLAGVPFGLHVTKMYGELDKPRNLGHFMLALDVAGSSRIRQRRGLPGSNFFSRKFTRPEPSSPSRPAMAPGEPERL
jgi:ureidoglycolate dehydrogenase (NAD+)